MMNEASQMHLSNLSKWYSTRDRSWYALMTSWPMWLDRFRNIWIDALNPFNCISSEILFPFSAFNRKISVWMLEKPVKRDAPRTIFGCRSNTKWPAVLDAHFFCTNSILLESNRRQANVCLRSNANSQCLCDSAVDVVLRMCQNSVNWFDRKNGMTNGTNHKQNILISKIDTKRVF